jgi:hypothetical protein
MIHAKVACLTISSVVENMCGFVTPGTIDDCNIALSIIAPCGLADRFVTLSLETLRFISGSDVRC